MWSHTRTLQAQGSIPWLNRGKHLLCRRAEKHLPPYGHQGVFCALLLFPTPDSSPTWPPVPLPEPLQPSPSPPAAQRAHGVIPPRPPHSSHSGCHHPATLLSRASEPCWVQNDLLHPVTAPPQPPPSRTAPGWALTNRCASMPMLQNDHTGDNYGLSRN